MNRKIIDSKKICVNCKIEKPVELFNKRTLKSGRLSCSSLCKICISEMGKISRRAKVSDHLFVPNMEGEFWIHIEGSDGYFVSNLLRIKSAIKQNRLYECIVVPRLQNTGRYSIPIIFDGKSRRISRYRIFAKAFIPNPENKPCINHINNDPTDDRLENLEWCTQKENMEHAKKYLRMQHGIERYNNAISENEVLDIFNSNESQRKLAKKYNVHQGTIAKIKTGQNWSHLTGKKYIKKYVAHRSCN